MYHLQENGVKEQASLRHFSLPMEKGPFKGEEPFKQLSYPTALGRCKRMEGLVLFLKLVTGAS